MNTIRVRVDLDYLEETCEVHIMKTLIHELIHAEIIAFLLDPNIDPSNFNEVYQSYRNQEGWSHEVMANWFRNRIKDALKEIYGDEYTEEEYDALSWAGLDEYTVEDLDGNITTNYITTAWQNLSLFDREPIKEIQNRLNKNCHEGCD